MGHHRRSLSAASCATDGTDATWHDALEQLEHLDLDSAHEEADSAQDDAQAPHAPPPVPEGGPRAVDWHDEAQMLPPNALSLEERMAAIHSMRKIVLAEPDSGACGLRTRSLTIAVCCGASAQPSASSCALSRSRCSRCSSAS